MATGGVMVRKGYSTQMNTRIGVELKAKGDAVFATLGLSASEAVRKFYEFAASCASNPGKLENVLSESFEDNAAHDVVDEETAKRLATVERGAHLYSDALRRMGIERSSASHIEFVNQPYADLREAALLEEYRLGEDA